MKRLGSTIMSVLRFFSLEQNDLTRVQAIFVITQVPINIQNSQSSGGPCPNNLEVQDQPQADSPLTGSPWLTQANKLATVGSATLASTSNVVLVSTQPQAGQGQNQAAGSGSESRTATSIIEVPPSTSASTTFVVATVAAGGNGSGSKINPAVYVNLKHDNS